VSRWTGLRPLLALVPLLAARGAATTTIAARDAPLNEPLAASQVAIRERTTTSPPATSPDGIQIERWLTLMPHRPADEAR
jgi:hypothetical protein